MSAPAPAAATAAPPPSPEINKTSRTGNNENTDEVDDGAVHARALETALTAQRANLKEASEAPDELKTRRSDAWYDCGGIYLDGLLTPEPEAEQTFAKSEI